MSIFILKQSKLTEVTEDSFKNEKEMQALVENNLEELFGLKFVASEFMPRGDLRIDTLAFDPREKNFVIIEYKKGSSWAVMDQGFSYLSLLLDRKADFVLEMNKNHSTKLAISDIAWETSRVIFVAPSFTTYQTGALGFQDVAFDLYKFQRHSGNIISLEQVQGKVSKAKLSEVQTMSEEARRVQREVKQFTVEDHFPLGREASKELFDEFTTRLLELDSRLSIHPVKTYIGISIGRKNIFSIHPRLSELKFDVVRFKPEDLKDPEKKLRYLENSKKNFNVHISEIRIKNKSDSDYALMVARQALAKY